MSELNKRAAELMFPDDMECGCECGHHKWNFSMNIQMPQNWNPEHNRSHCDILLDRIAEEGLEKNYEAQLRRILFAKDEDYITAPHYTFGWRLLTATPAQIVDAFNKTMEEADEQRI